MAVNEGDSQQRGNNAFLARLSRDVVIGDGAMATLLHQGGVPIRTCYEALSVTAPDAVRHVHEAYLLAGADWIQTNTFGAHRSGLSRYGLEADVVAINRAATRVARSAIRHVESASTVRERFVFGTVGSILGARGASVPSLPIQGSDVSLLRAEYEEQICALLSAEVDGLVLETFADVDELLFAIELTRALTDLPIVANLSPEAVGVTRDGVPLPEAFHAMRQAGADVLGLNCRLGPSGILRSFEGLPQESDVLYAAVPNAGLLHVVEGDFAYTGSADYFADVAVRLAEQGVRLIGGCCGTTPEHVKRVLERLSDWRLAADVPTSPVLHSPQGTLARRGHVAQRKVDVTVIPTAVPPDATLTSPLLRAVQERTTVIVELDPPRTLDPARFLAGAAALHDAGADYITMADNSLGHVRVSNIALAALLKHAGVEPLVHVTCRDRNLLGQQSHLMGLDVLGVQHLLLVTGDPTRFGDLPGATSVYDVSSIELTRMVKRLNAGVAFSGQPMRHPSQFIVGTSFNPHVAQFDKAVARLHQKVEAGADFVMTQPVFDERMMEQIAKATEQLGVPVFIGIMPLVSHRNAQFLHNEVPGIYIPETILQRMADAHEPAAAAEGLLVAAGLIDRATEYFNGLYLITPFLRYELTVKLTEYARRLPRSAESILSL